ncbi:MAG TPA: sortase [Candidatus Paceibacterota bacterium]|nr:sortase [Candidatus Paceibacterota bacterium]
MATTHKHTVEKQGGFGAFSVTFVLLFVLVYGFLAVVDALPDPSHTKPVAKAPVVGTTPTSPELPVRIIASTISLDVSVANPMSTNVDTLDAALLKGAVRYPTSARLGVEGTVLIFGHSSYLPIVHNQAYKAFDGIQNLKVGETISVYSSGREYRYSVTSVKVADATSDVVELPTKGKHLVLVTCDSFSKKTNRFVVTADFVGTYSLASN